MLGPLAHVGADVEQQYLPDELADRRYYLPTDQGYESTIAERTARRAAARSPQDPREHVPPERVGVGIGLVGQLHRLTLDGDGEPLAGLTYILLTMTVSAS